MTKKKESAEKAIRDIRRATRRQYSAEEKIRIVLENRLLKKALSGLGAKIHEISCLRET
jgi:transposase